MLNSVRRAGAALAVGAVALTGLSTVTTAPAGAASRDAAPARDGAPWLRGELEKGLLVGQFGPDYGLSIDAGLALSAVGQDAGARKVRKAVAADLGAYITGDAFGDAGSTYAGAAAKALVLAQATGKSGRSVGGLNLVGRLQQRVSTASGISGRLEDKSNFGDFANTIGQAFAVQGLSAADSKKAAPARKFLLRQQCGAGYFRLAFTADKTAADQTCDGGRAAGESPADTDVTALVVIALADQGDRPKVRVALRKAGAWLAKQQKGNGSFGGGPSTEASNTNSTGLAGWALGSIGKTGKAARAAVWVRKHQATDVGTCTPWAKRDTGAVAYDDAAFATGLTEGVTDATRDQFRRATAQALPVLRWAPGPAARTRVALKGSLRAGTTAKVRVTGLAPGATVCGWIGKKAGDRAFVNRAGKVTVRIALPASAGKRTLRVADSSGTALSIRMRVRPAAS